MTRRSLEPAAPASGTGDLEIGKSVFGEYWDGLLDEVQIHDRVLTEAEIAALASGKGGGGGAIDIGTPSSFTVADDFETGDYTGSSGDMPWAGPWLEVGESDGSGSGGRKCCLMGRI